MTDDKITLRRATAYLDYAHQRYLEGKEPGRLTWEMKLGDFIAYSGLAYKWHPDNDSISPTERLLTRHLFWGIYTTRFGQDGQVKAITLGQLKELMEGPLGATYPKLIGERSVQYLNTLLVNHGLQPIASRKLRHDSLESVLKSLRSESPDTQSEGS